MSGLAEAALVIVVVGLAIRNRTLTKEKELLFKQLCRMRDEEEGERTAVSMRAKPGIAEVPGTTQNIPVPVQTLASRHSANTGWTYTSPNTSCPDCGSTEFEMRTHGGPMEYADTHCAKCGRLIRRFDAA
jgi:hypothetical protein